MPKTVLVVTNDADLTPAEREELHAYARVNQLWFSETPAFASYLETIVNRFTFVVERSTLGQQEDELVRRGWVVKHVRFMNGALFLV